MTGEQLYETFRKSAHKLGMRNGDLNIQIIVYADRGSNLRHWHELNEKEKQTWEHAATEVSKPSLLPRSLGYTAGDGFGHAQSPEEASSRAAAHAWNEHRKDKTSNAS